MSDFSKLMYPSPEISAPVLSYFNLSALITIKLSWLIGAIKLKLVLPFALILYINSNEDY